MLVDANFSAPNLDLYLGLKPELTLHDVLAGEAGEGLHNAIYEKHKVDIVPAAMIYKKEVNPLNLKKILLRVKGRYDFIILDSSPNYNELIPVVAASDKLFVVSTPDFQTLSTSLKASFLAKSKKTPIEGIVINKIRNPKYEMNLKEIEESMKIPVVAKIRDDKKMTEALFHKTPMTIHNKNHHISEEIKRFSSALIGMPEIGSGFLRNIWPWDKCIKKEKVNRELMRQKFYEDNYVI